MSPSDQTQFLRLAETSDGVSVEIAGAWSFENLNRIDKEILSLEPFKGGEVIFDLAKTTKLDTSGALMLNHILRKAKGRVSFSLANAATDYQEILDRVVEIPAETSGKGKRKSLRAQIVDSADRFIMGFGDFWRSIFLSIFERLSFFGEVFVSCFRLIFRPNKIRYMAVLNQIQLVGINSLFITGLISFLIGMVIVNQGAIQLAKFGAEIYVIDMLGILHLRELGVLLTSIIVAGRCGSAFTAQLGSMKLAEEVDALRTLSLSPMDVLVVPRFVALVIALPLLTVWADIMGMLGGMLLAWAELEISPYLFFTYIQSPEKLPIVNFVDGLIKAPFFAAIIALSGCFEGMKVQNSAASLGARTTQSVVMSIFLVIAMDAAFAVIFSKLGL